MPLKIPASEVVQFSKDSNGIIFFSCNFFLFTLEKKDILVCFSRVNKKKLST